jgi:hypothetical protein
MVRTMLIILQLWLMWRITLMMMMLVQKPLSQRPWSPLLPPRAAVVVEGFAALTTPTYTRTVIPRRRRAAGVFTRRNNK